MECCELLSDLLPLALSHNIEIRWNLNFWLWIAFRFTTFGIEPQLIGSVILEPVRCELLSDLLPLALSHNCHQDWTRNRYVVNCFQIYYLWHWATTWKLEILHDHSLWIAFRFTTFGIEPQLNIISVNALHSCELLSDLLPLALSHNRVYTDSE